ncbi:putative reverse transcriptase domain-containing protein [Tanacetum coccineum]
MVPTKQKKIEAYIRGLSENIKGEVTSSEPTTLNKAVQMAHTLMEQKVKARVEVEADITRKAVRRTSKEQVLVVVEKTILTVNQQPLLQQIVALHKHQPRNNQNNQRQGNVSSNGQNVGNQNTNEAGQNVKCNKCGMQHYGNCPIKCNKCGKIGHKARECWSKVVATGANAPDCDSLTAEQRIERPH